ncbi:MAG TPA: type II secretion system F family protein [Dehalococcoidia bacterium]|nr:type II secretion system F family protein [Dehalococcoidia bacterium]
MGLLVPIFFGAFITAALGAIALSGTLTAQGAALGGRIDQIATGVAVSVADLSGQRLLRMQGYSNVRFLQRLLQGTPRAEKIAYELDRANLRLSVGQYLAVSVAIGLILAIGVAALLPVPLRILGVLPFLLGVYLPRWWVKRRIRGRRTEFETALPDALDMLVRSLRSGMGFLLALGNMAEQMGGVLGAEFQHLQQTVDTGLSIEEAFRELDRRMQSKDLKIVVTAFLIQREVGGSLSETLGNIIAMMRERVKLRGELKTMVARELWSTYMMAAVPPIMLLFLTFIARSLIQPMYDSPIGWWVLAAAALMEVLGILVVRRLASPSIEV